MQLSVQAPARIRKDGQSMVDKPHLSPTRRVTGLLLAAAVIATPLFSTPTASAAPGPLRLTSAEEVNALTERSVVQLGTQWTGYVYYRTATGMAWTDKPVQTGSTCSGFFVSETGHIATAGHCVDPAEGRELLIRSFLAGQVADGLISAQTAAAILPEAIAEWRVESTKQGSAADRTIYVGQPSAVQDAPLQEVEIAQLVDFKPFDQGDMALLKIDGVASQPLPIAEQDPNSGATLTAVGFPGSVGDVVNPTKVRASFKSGTASSQQQTSQGYSQTEVNADISGGMSGGPTIDAEGNVLGINSYKINGEDQNFNFITDTTDLRDWLRSRNMTLVPPRGAADAGVDEPSSGAGGGWLLLGILGGLMLLVLAGAGIGLWLYLRSRKPSSYGGAHGSSSHHPDPRQTYGGAHPMANGAASPTLPFIAPPVMPHPGGPHATNPGGPNPRVVDTGWHSPQATAPYAGPHATAPGGFPPGQVLEHDVRRCARCGSGDRGLNARFCGNCGSPMAQS